LINVTISANVSASAVEADKIASTLPFSTVILDAKAPDTEDTVVSNAPDTAVSWASVA